ncbi:levanase [Abditibacteriota bacterium]|nr:levanase [Abditibacteriota bacterium]
MHLSSRLNTAYIRPRIFTSPTKSLSSVRWLANGAIMAFGMGLVSCASTTAPSRAQAEPTKAQPILAEKPVLYCEKYRPQFHFSSQSGWMGDPDALVHYGGYYHIFWWGHAISRDLVHWTELPWPMIGDDGSFKYYTGSAVVDKDNTAGFGPNSMVAVYTMHQDKDNLETIGLSSSQNLTDFQHFSGSPVLNTNSTDFRDPQVFWHAPTKRWIMLVAIPGQRKIVFYSSPDLKKWQHLSDFGATGAQGNSWEVPDLFPLSVDGDATKTKWVLTIGVSPNKTQYFLGDFDGTRFSMDAATKAFLNDGAGIEGTLFAGFGGDNYDGWTTTGTAFGNGPSHSESPRHLGAGQADSFGDSDAATGTLTSPAFTITKKAINFLIAGGNHPNQTCINLLVGDKVVRTTTGDNTGSLKWNGWDVSEFVGQSATIQLVDSYTGTDFGHFTVDHIMFSDAVKDDHLEQALWADYGSDFYAARTWRDADDTRSRTTWIGWLGNWEYANDVPSSWGQGFESIPRDLSLKTFPEGVRLVQTPVTTLQSLRETPVRVANRALEQGTKDLAEFTLSRNTYEMEAEFATDSRAVFGFNLLVGDGRKLVLGYDATKAQLFLDRTRTSDFSTNQTFNSNFPKRMTAPLQATAGKIKLHIFVDQSSVEVLADEGKVVLSALTFPGDNQKGVQLFCDGGKAQLMSLSAWKLNSIWNQSVKSVPGTLEASDFDSGKATTIKADYSGDYLVTSQVSAGNGIGQFHLELDGKDVSGPIHVSAADKNVAHRISIPFGQHELRFRGDAGTVRLDSMTIGAADGEIVNGGIYQIVARHSGRVLDSSGSDDGAFVQQWQWLGGDNQKWKIESVGDGYYRLTSVSSGKVLDVDGDKDGAPALQYLAMNNGHQKWHIQNMGGGYYTLLSKAANKALEVAANSKQNGGKVQQWQYLGGASQQWKLKLLDGAQ